LHLILINYYEPTYYASLQPLENLTPRKVNSTQTQKTRTNPKSPDTPSKEVLQKTSHRCFQKQTNSVKEAHFQALANPRQSPQLLQENYTQKSFFKT